MRSNNETHKFSGQSTAALLSNKIANVLTGEAEHEKITKKGYICAANNHRQKKDCLRPSSTKAEQGALGLVSSK